MKLTVRKLITGLLLVMIAVPASAATFDVDPSHSSITFAVKHMTVSKVKGAFGEFEASFEFDLDNPKSWSCQATIQAASVTTGNTKRDDHLRSEDFFNTSEFPTITFKSTGVTMEDEEDGVLRGELTMMGVTRAIELELELVGMVDDPWGNTRAGFSAEGDIQRKDWGLTWNNTLDSGGLVVGDKIEIELEIEGILRK